MVKDDRDPEAWARAVRKLRARNEDARSDLLRELSLLQRKYEKAVTEAAEAVNDLGGPAGESEGLKHALREWRIAAEEASQFIFDEERFPPGSDAGWKSRGWEEAVRLGDRAVRAFAKLEKKVFPGLKSALVLEPGEAEALEKAYDRAASAHRRVADEAGEETPVPEIRNLSRILLLVARGELTAANAAISEMPRGGDRFRAFYAYSHAFLARNRPVLKGAAGPTRAGMAELNRYRMSLGHTPLLLNEKLMQAARGHSEEMKRLGYFSHDSPIEAHRTEWDRARLAGYVNQVSENIYQAASLPRALAVWKQSAKHHRTMALPSAVDAGVGVRGPCTMVFGQGEKDTPPELQY